MNMYLIQLLGPTATSMKVKKLNIRDKYMKGKMKLKNSKEEEH